MEMPDGRSGHDVNRSIALTIRVTTLRAVVARHPLLAFVALAYGISWLCWGLMWLFDTGEANGIFIVGATGPALAAMAVAAILQPEPSGVSAGKRWRRFGWVWLLTFACLALRRFWLTLGLVDITLRVDPSAIYPSRTALLLDVLATAAVAFVLTGTLSPRQGVRELLRALDPRSQPVRWYWWVLAVGLYPVVMALGNTLSAALGQAVPARRAGGAWVWLATDVVLTFVYVLLFGGGLEEPGWRGFVLPRLLKRFSPLGSSLILAVIWAFWHWPIFWFGYFGGGPFGVFGFALGVAPLAILLTAVFNRSGGSLLAVVLLHTSVNITPTYLPASTLSVSLWMLLVAGVAVRMWRFPRSFSSPKMARRLGEGPGNRREEEA